MNDKNWKTEFREFDIKPSLKKKLRAFIKSKQEKELKKESVKAEIIEHIMIDEINRLAEYAPKNYKFSKT